MAAARQVLAAEMDALAANADDAEAMFARYGAALKAMAAEVLYIPSKARYGRASLHSKQDAIDAAEHEHKTLCEQMQKGVKKALKMEKKLLIALGGYAVRKKSGGTRGEGLPEAEENCHVRASVF